MSRVDTLPLPGLEPPAPVPSPETTNYHWYTPAPYVEAARQVMGGIDLDPASCLEAQKVVQATRYYTREDDGLMQPWSGKVWLNPPYATALIESFLLGRLIPALEANEVGQAVVLTNNCTETGWCQTLMAHAWALCFPKGRIHFWGPLERGNSPRQGQMFFYFQSEGIAEPWRIDLFVRWFGGFGQVVKL